MRAVSSRAVPLAAIAARRSNARKAEGPDIRGRFNRPPDGTGSATGRLPADEFFLSIRRAF
ncbi:MAG: hypothetical protein JNK22_17005 [Rhodocyclaceae bacterium]|nr:hypothetical protein [Rhodocyclaceae bacterium]